MTNNTIKVPKPTVNWVKTFNVRCFLTRVCRYGLDDVRTPVFIFERLCNLIFPVSRMHSDVMGYHMLFLAMFVLSENLTPLV